MRDCAVKMSKKQYYRHIYVKCIITIRHKYNYTTLCKTVISHHYLCECYLFAYYLYNNIRYNQLVKAILFLTYLLLYKIIYISYCKHLMLYSNSHTTHFDYFEIILLYKNNIVLTSSCVNPSSSDARLGDSVSNNLPLSIPLAMVEACSSSYESFNALEKKKDGYYQKDTTTTKNILLLLCNINKIYAYIDSDVLETPVER